MKNILIILSIIIIAYLFFYFGSRNTANKNNAQWCRFMTTFTKKITDLVSTSGGLTQQEIAELQNSKNQVCSL